MDAPFGIEPKSPDSKSAILPLDDGAMANAVGLEPTISRLEDGRCAGLLRSDLATHSYTIPSVFAVDL